MKRLLLLLVIVLFASGCVYLKSPAKSLNEAIIQGEGILLYDGHDNLNDCVEEFHR